MSVVAGWGGLWGAGSGGGSSYVSVKIPKFVYRPARVTIVSGALDQITFGEGGGALTATVAPGEYTWGALAQMIQVALEAAGAGDYTVTYSLTTRMYTLVKSAGTFTLDYSAGTRDLLPTIGITADKSGALTYTSDSAVPSETTITCTQLSRHHDAPDECDRADFEAGSGRTEHSLIVARERLTFTVEFESTAVHRTLKDMWRLAGRYGAPIDYYPDSTLSDYITVIWDQPRYPLAEMTRDRGLYRRYAGELAFRVRVPAGGTITARAFDDRRPSS